jgi:hypothetical protein
MPGKQEAVEIRRKRARGSHFRIEPEATEVPTWAVESESGGKYRVMLPSFPSREGAQCSCPDFLTRGLGTCKHLEAVLAYAALNPPPRPPPPRAERFPWEDLERSGDRLAEEVDQKGLRSEALARRLRKQGRVLVGTSPPQASQ